MSDLNDDILNYELGDVDIEDMAGDEDELLLSDEESTNPKLSKQQEEQLLDETEEWVSLELAKASIVENSNKKIAESNKKKDIKLLNNKSIQKSNFKIENSDSSSKNNINSNKDSEVTTTNDLVLEKKTINESKSVTQSVANDRQFEFKTKFDRSALKKIITKEKLNEVSSSIESIGIPVEENEEIPVSSTDNTNCLSVNQEFTIENEPTYTEHPEEQIENATTDITSDEFVQDIDESVGSVLYLNDESIVDVYENSEQTEEDSAIEYEEEYDEREERLNPKTSVERGHLAMAGYNIDQYPNPRGYSDSNIRGQSINPHRGGRTFIPRGGYPPRPPFPQYAPRMSNDSNDFLPHQPFQQIPQNFHPNQHPDFRGPNIPPVNYRGPRPPPIQGTIRPIVPQIEFIQQLPPRGPRPDHLMPNQQFRPFNPLIIIPNSMPRPPMSHPRFDQMRPRPPLPHFPNTHLGPRPQIIHTQNYLPARQPHPVNIQPQNMQQPPSTTQPTVPRKILINPNFKRGGWEAAKSQLLMDNFMNTNYISSFGGAAQNEDELLRQQEAFINQNRLHIEKRRHERSPDRERDRERDYSPPSRRERRAYSREREFTQKTEFRGRPKRDGENYDGRYMPKRRRSESFERDGKDKVEEDEETRAYRLEIEKQKAMREKILREKEERRKKAAEDKLKPNSSVSNSEKKSDDESTSAATITTSVSTTQPQKLKPLVVKESKIISLKKKSEVSSTTQQIPQTIKSIPTAKIIPETKKLPDIVVSNKESTTAVVKPQVKNLVLKTHSILTSKSDDEDIDEDALLADSPSPPPTPPLETFRPRRVVLKPSSEASATAKLLQTKSFSVKNDENTKINKGIFDRLEKKISVTEQSKRTIQRIVLNNAE